jgi:hypothetical protein
MEKKGLKMEVDHLLKISVAFKEHLVASEEVLMFLKGETCFREWEEEEDNQVIKVLEEALKISLLTELKKYLENSFRMKVNHLKDNRVNNSSNNKGIVEDLII